MNHRIRVSALVLRESGVLLVKHVHPHTKKAWWCPPGGAIEGEESLFEGAEREALEETGLQVNAERVVYVSQFLDRELGHHNLEVYILARESTRRNGPGVPRPEPGSAYIREVRFLSRADLAEGTVFPEILRGEFRDDLDAGFPSCRFLGVSRTSPPRPDRPPGE